MRVVIIGREFSDYNREVREWKREFLERAGIEPEELDPDSVEGESFSRARDITRYPTIAVATESGEAVEQWSGTPLPSIDVVMNYL